MRSIFGCEFGEDAEGRISFPKRVISHTTKTQFLFRINKGCLDVWDTAGINAHQPMEKRPVPFSRMIFIGDGETDVPCMSLVKNLGGYSVAVHKPGSAAKKKAKLLLEEGRVNLISAADYSLGSVLDREVKKFISQKVYAAK